jgi:F-type H+-transporting ATPase subunit delta
MSNSASNSVIAHAVLSRLESGESSDKVTASLAAFLIEEKKVGSLGAIIREIERLLLSGRDTLYLHITTAHTIDDAVLQPLIEKFKQQNGASKVIIEHTINKSVIGGVRCETAQQRLDLTVRRQLQRLTGVTA